MCRINLFYIHKNYPHIPSHLWPSYFHTAYRIVVNKALTRYNENEEANTYSVAVDIGIC